MKKILILLLIACIPVVLWSQKKITLEDIYKNNTFAYKSVQGFNAMKGDEFYSKIENGNEINIYNLKSGKKEINVLNTKNFPALSNNKNIQSYEWSEDETKLILKFEGENIYRHSTKYLTYYYDTENKSLQKIDNEKILHASFNPQGTKIAFVKDNNLYIYDIATKTTKAITTDGKWNHIINGNCDWVYEEEFSFTKAYQWSPDGDYIAYYKFDESKVRMYTMTVYDSLYPTPHTFKYPKAGEDNSIVSIHLYNIYDNTTHTGDLGNNNDQYIPRIKWANDKDLCILRLNRLQNHLDFLIHNADEGTTNIMMSNTDPYYVEIADDFIFYENGRKMLYTSEKDGWKHIYTFDRITDKALQITKGSYDIREVLGYDEDRNLVFFTAGKDNPTHQSLYSVREDGSSVKMLTPPSSWNVVTPFSSMRYFLVEHSASNQVPQFSLIDQQGKQILNIEDNMKLQSTLGQYQWGEVSFFHIPSADEQTKLNAWKILPPNFSPTKKYPVLMYQYSGPGSQEVEQKFFLGNYFWHQYLAQEGYIIVCVDGRGTGSRGREFKKQTYKQLGKIESDDQIAAARHIAKWDYVDKERIGIWGWSYGGFMSAICIMKGNDIFKTAISVAPVTNWRYYDNIYTERYMRTPQENPTGYDQNAPENMAAKLNGNLLLIHGTSDDNVHFQNAVMLTNALIKEGKQFESIYYPNKDHGIRGGNTRLQLFQKMTNYIKEHL